MTSPVKSAASNLVGEFSRDLDFGCNQHGRPKVARTTKTKTRTARKTSTRNTKSAAKATAFSQGWPDVYLNADTGNFRPGYDARAKTDAINAVLKVKDPNALHVFKPATAQKLLAARGSESALVARRELLARKAKAA